MTAPPSPMGAGACRGDFTSHVTGFGSGVATAGSSRDTTCVSGADRGWVADDEAETPRGIKPTSINNAATIAAALCWEDPRALRRGADLPASAAASSMATLSTKRPHASHNTTANNLMAAPSLMSPLRTDAHTVDAEGNGVGHGRPTKLTKPIGTPISNESGATRAAKPRSKRDTVNPFC